MPSVPRRSALDALTKAQLLDLARQFDLDIAAARPKAQVVDALAQTRRVSFVELLAALDLKALKTICRAHELSETAAKKQILIDRILDEQGSTPEPQPKSYGSKKRPKAKPTAKPEGELDYARSTKLNLQSFALDTAGGYRVGDPQLRFATELIRCFGWQPNDELPAEIPATVRVVQHGKAVDRRMSALLRDRKAVVEVVARDRGLEQAWAELFPVLLQLNPVPQYVVVTNQRDVALYDLARSHDAAQLTISTEQLAKYSEAFPFLARDWSPGSMPTIINVERVSKHVADLVARVYRSFKAEHPKRIDDITRFTLQCILAMFAEDVGLLPRQYFTSLLYEGAAHGDTSSRLTELFRQMSTPGDGDRSIRYFNGGLFEQPVTLPISSAQLIALTKAAEADWTYVDPHIFGAVFQGIMDDDERHATGAHYTAKDDIMRVVGPTIVEPWRRRIAAATTLGELRALRKELTVYRVLDPACGSGNFLYIAFRELYRLETELLVRMQEFPSIGDDSTARTAWGSGIPTTNFFGIDINGFAVELARATLNIAKKIAFDERHQVALERFKQVEMELDPSLPLDNLEKNVVCADALFVDWPAVDAIVGNPPILGGQKIRKSLGEEYLLRLRELGDYVGEISCYWFRRAHDRLQAGGRAGLVGTSGLRHGKARIASLDYVVENGGTITNAVSSMPWPGEAALDVCMVNWVKGGAEGPYQLVIENRTYHPTTISSHLQLHTDLNAAAVLTANGDRSMMGVTFGNPRFTSDGGVHGFPQTSDTYVRPTAAGTALLTGALERQPVYGIYMVGLKDQREAMKLGGNAFAYLEQHLFAAGSSSLREGKWWEPERSRRDFFAGVASKRRMIVCSNPQARPIFVFLSTAFIPTNTLQVFAFDDDYSFGVIQSSLHWGWLKAKGGKLSDRLRYTTEVWRTFPWPQDVPEAIVERVAVAARALRETRQTLMQDNNWSLRALYQAADVTGAHPLKTAQASLDEAVAAAYDLPQGQDPLEFLLELNVALAEDEANGHSIAGPGLPVGLDAADPRWTSDDCIEPPPLNSEDHDHG